jgi:hypothetical protein
MLPSKLRGQKHVRHLRKGSLVLFGGLALTLAAASCSGPGADDDDTARAGAAAGAGAACRGAYGCECDFDHLCNRGLRCEGKRCVMVSDGGSAGTGSAGRSTGAGGSPGGAAGEGESGSGGAGTSGGSGGSGNVSGQGGEGAASMEGGAPGNAGAGGSGNAGGKAGSGNGGGQGGYGASSGMGGGGTAGSPPCTPITIGGVAIDLSYAPDIASYGADVSPELGNGNPDLLVLSYFATYDGVPAGGDETGTFELGTGIDENYETCARCLHLQVDSDTKFYFASAGTLTLDSDSKQMYGYPQGTLRNVTLREATYDAGNFHSTFVPGGACYTVANADFMVDFQPPAPGWICEASYYHDNSDCDCGCGAPDPDCANTTYAACEYCYCGTDGGDCTGSSVSSTENHLCN